MSDDLASRAAGLREQIAALAANAADRDPALRARLQAALQALQGESTARNTALTQSANDMRVVVRDVLAEELDRFWERRFGRSS